MTTIKQLFQWGETQLEFTSDSPRLDAEILLSHTLDCSKTYLYTYPEKVITNNQICHFKKWIELRQTGYPVAYLTGIKSFWSLELIVNEHTLIPRPETEILVEVGLEKIKQMKAPNILDLGTGSGAIALAIASERPDANIIAVDNSFSALTVARKNQHHNNLKNIQFICSNWLSSCNTKWQFDLIISNPPYIAEGHEYLEHDIRFEPVTALTSGINGMKDIIHIIKTAQSFLKTDSWLLFEHGFDQAEASAALLRESNYKDTQCWYDYAGLERVSGGMYSCQ